MIPERPIEYYCEDIPRQSTKDHAMSVVRLYLGSIYNFKKRGKYYLTKEEKDTFERLAIRYLEEERDYTQDIIKYFQKFEGRTASMNTRLSNLATFLEKYGKTVDRRKIKVKMPKRYQKTTDSEIDTNLVRNILEHSDELVKAMVLVMFSSGMRIGEVLNLKYEDISSVEGEMCYKVHITGDMEKTGHDKYTFFTEEAMKAIEAWLLVRDKYIASKKQIKPNEERFKKYEPTDCLFPLTRPTFIKKFHNVLKRAGLYKKDEVTKHCNVHPHVFRNAFRTSMIAAGCPIDIVESFIHAQRAYAHYSNAQLVKAYTKAMHAVTTNYDAEMKSKLDWSLDLNEKMMLERKVTKETNEALTQQLLNSMNVITELLSKQKQLNDEITELQNKNI